MVSTYDVGSVTSSTVWAPAGAATRTREPMRLMAAARTPARTGDSVRCGLGGQTHRTHVMTTLSHRPDQYAADIDSCQPLRRDHHSGWQTCPPATGTGPRCWRTMPR